MLDRRHHVRTLRALAPLIAVVSVALLSAPTAAERLSRQIQKLPEKYQRFLTEVDLLISKEETRALLALTRDHQRDGFIEAFWAARDPYPETDRNEFREMWIQRLEHAQERFGRLDSAQAKILLLNGEPTEQASYPRCMDTFRPLETWRYRRTPHSQVDDVALLFVKGSDNATPRVWYPSDGLATLVEGSPDSVRLRCSQEAVSLAEKGEADQYQHRLPRGDLPAWCVLKLLERSCHSEEAKLIVLDILRSAELGGYDLLVNRLEQKRRPRDGEWLESFAAFSTDLAPEATPLVAELEIGFGARRQSRLVVDGTVWVEGAGLGIAEVDGRQLHELQLNGEVLRGDELLESFRYRFQPAVDGEVSRFPLAFQRALRPGQYQLTLLLEDLRGGGQFRIERTLEVPTQATTISAGEEADELAETPEVDSGLAPRRGLRLAVPHQGMVHGPVRAEVEVEDPAIKSVALLLDGRYLMTRRSPPFSFAVTLARVPRLHRLEAIGYDRTKRAIASDTVDINAGDHRFRVRIVEPSARSQAVGKTTVLMEAETPEGAQLDRVELFLEEQLVTTLFAEPYLHPVELPAGLTYLRAVAHLDDTSRTEHTLFVNAPPELEQIDVKMVELHVGVLDEARRPIVGLEAADFRILEDGVPQELRRCEPADDLPIHTALLLDTSASMEASLLPVREAAVRFLRQIVSPKDRAAVFTFNQRPRLLEGLTNDVDALARALAGLSAEGGTALYDSIVFALHSLNGLSGPRALLLLSDGRDESSTFTFEDALEHARASGVRVYAIGLALPSRDLAARRELRRLAEITGGATYFIDSVDQLAPIYEEIERGLRSQYALSYQSSNSKPAGDFRSIEVEVPQLAGAKVSAPSGYYP